VATVKVITSAERRFAAVSNDRRVRVDGSMNTVATVPPPERGHLRDRALGHLGERVGEAHDLEDPVAAQIGHGQKVPNRWSPVASEQVLRCSR